jgi:hypothetical protein
MFPLLINPLPLLLTLTTSFGVLFHDSQLDRASSIALSLPVAFAAVGSADLSFKLNDPHLHAERISIAQRFEQLRSSQPRIQTRNSEDKKYISTKKFSSDTDGSEYRWPST